MKPLLALVALCLALPASAQGLPSPPPPPGVTRPMPPRPAPPAYRSPGPRRLGGPRTGVTFLSPGAVEKLNDTFDYASCHYDYESGTDVCVNDAPTVDPSFPVVTQFGWQFERRLFQAESGLTGVTEWVLLVGGAERGLFLPSATFLAGVRAPGGFEVGVGPNLSLAGAAYAVAVGMNNEIGEVNVPLNAAIVLGQDGPRVSLLVGFNVSERRW